MDQRLPIIAHITVTTYSTVPDSSISTTVDFAGNMSKRNAGSEPSASASKMQKVDLPEKANIFLAKMLEHHKRGMTSGYEKLRVELGIGQRVKSQQAAWKLLREEAFIEEAEGKDFRLTQKGLDHAATPEYKEYIKELNIVSLTNEDHQARIRNKLLDAKYKAKTIQIFDLLDKYGSLTAIELAALIGCKRGTHKFSYGLKELKEKNYVEVDPSGGGKKLRLADTAFLTPEDRKKPEAIDPAELAKAVEENSQRKKGPNKKEEEAKRPAKEAKKKAGKGKASEVIDHMEDSPNEEEMDSSGTVEGMSQVELFPQTE